MFQLTVLSSDPTLCCVWAASVRSQDNKRLHNPNGIMRWGAVSLVGGQSRKTWSRLGHEEGISYGHLLFIHSISASHHGSAPAAQGTQTAIRAQPGRLQHPAWHPLYLNQWNTPLYSWSDLSLLLKRAAEKQSGGLFTMISVLTVFVWQVSLCVFSWSHSIVIINSG